MWLGLTVILGVLLSAASSCPTNCICDDDSDVCKSCIDGYFLGSDKGHLNCLGSCYKNCRKCTAPKICSECWDGYYNPGPDEKDSFYCQRSCRGTCKRCTDLNTCTECRPNFKGPKCDQCVDGYYGEGEPSYCKYKCRSTCVSCTSIDNCTTCTLGHKGTRCDMCMEDGKYGSNCDKGCPASCKTCTGNNCQTCKAGYTGKTCERCIAGKYGTLCSQTCPPECKDSTCLRDSGHCQQCKEGWYGATCDQHCPERCHSCTAADTCQTCTMTSYTGKVCQNCIPGKYGAQCDQDCPERCQTCTAADSCQACKDHYAGPVCQNCIPRKYGPHCSQDCPESCVTCTARDQCQYCKPHFAGSACQFCVPGKHGKKCDKDCPEFCKTCTAANVCHSCKDGYLGTTCDRCVKRKYGPQCDQECPKSCSACTAKDACQECKTGYRGTTCQNCIVGKYGATCEQDCPSECKNDVCHRSNGQCSDCKEGRYGNRCDQDCPESCQTCKSATDCRSCKDGYRGTTCEKCIPGKYGSQCNQNCPSSCQTCTSATACQSCKTGYLGTACEYCIPGKYGSQCDQDCPETCHLCTSANACQTCKGPYRGNVCEFCIPGKYGSQCDIDCPSKCNHGTCERSSGHCQQCIEGIYGDTCDWNCPETCQTCTASNNCQVCKSRYRGPVCEYCVTRKYGSKCDQDCPLGCKGGICDRSSGHCQQCKRGWYGDKCDNDCPSGCKDDMCDQSSGHCQQCKKGRYGNACNQDCPSGCKDGTCDKSSGHCHQCKKGWYGNACDLDCPSGCKDDTCEKSSGHCKQCKKGWHGNTCTLSCPSNCKNGVCDRHSGACDSCVPSYHGSNCTERCPENCINCSSYQNCDKCKIGHYGDTCESKCPSSCKNNTCDKRTGRCKEGCKDKYYGTKCENKCPIPCTKCRWSTHCDACEVGFYGYTCGKKCGHCKHGKQCNKLYGECNGGCTDGYYGNRCSGKCSDACKTCKSWESCESCIDGKYGKHRSRNYYTCYKDCPEHCLNKSCDPDTGNCLACVDGYTGNKCDCPEHCQNCLSPEVCTSCKAGYMNTSKQCTCTQATCTTSTCEACNDHTWYVDTTGISCCECNRNCKNRECSAENRCTKGCVAGYYGDDCGKSCSTKDNNCTECTSIGDEYGGCIDCRKGSYPDGANSTCSACRDRCVNHSCSSRTGRCTDGCIPKSWGNKCDKDCPENCLKCDRESGDCFECLGGKYWKDCSKNCSSTCNGTESNLICNVDDGKCTHGCTNNTLQGPQCKDKCSSGCLEVECDWQTGKCRRGCRENFYGDTCSTACSDECGNVTSGRRCLENNGSCVNDCFDGFHGDRCDVKCSEHCANVTCSRDGGVCDAGCVDGYVGGMCTQAEQTGEPEVNIVVIAAIGAGVLLIFVILVILVVLRKRKQRNQKENIGSTTTHETGAGGQEGAGAGGQEGAGVDSTSPPPFVPRAGPSDGATYSNVSESIQLYAVPEKRKATAGVTNPAHGTPTKDKPIQGQRPVSRSDNQAKAAVKQHPKPNSASNKNPEPMKDTPVYAGNVKANTDSAVGAEESRANVNADEGLDKVGNDELEVHEDMVPPEDTGDADDSTYYNTFSARIPVEKLQHYVANTWAQGFYREFQQLPYGLKQPYEDSQKPENISKNRYKDIYPYDHSRVHLAGLGGDYINACYIDGFQHEKAYIASLGPTEKTMPGFVDFWRMVWQKNVEKIVMLTNLYENGMMKCDKYWPEHGTSVTYGDVTVTCHSEDTYAEYTVRTFTVAQGPDKRSLHHIHFTAWPDKGVPDDVTGLIEFRQKVESCQAKLNGPMIVHCSAGIGRTGTYIALDILTRQGHKDRAVNIYGCLLTMREQRICMVQTKEQYHYLHQAVVHALTFDSDAIQSDEFHKRLAAMKGGYLIKQFQQLQRTCVHLSETETEAVQINRSRDQLNRKGADIPGNLHRPYLTQQGTSDAFAYINAVYINSFTRSSHYITAQTPLPNTVTDFLTLIDQYNCVCIVSMDPDQLKDKSVGTYLPSEKKSDKHGTYTVTSGAHETGPGYKVRKLTLSYKGKNTVKKTLSHFQLTQWPDTAPTPRDAGKFVEFIKKVESSATKTDPNGRILVHCLTGAERSGLFCVVSVLIQKMEIEHQVSVVNTVRQVKSRRMLAIPNKEQFVFCHDCVDASLP